LGGKEDQMNIVKISKFLSYTLRHRPDEIGLQLDPQGWASVQELIDCAARHGTRLTQPMICEVVAQNDKQRFALSEDGTRIRASQGHSIEIDLNLSPQVPPEYLFHGTADRFVAAIRASGLERRQRQHVHLSAEEATAINVGSRHGRPVVLRVKAGAMHAEGRLFYFSANGVWLTEEVPTRFIEFP
jgi:putative RNA 2'-phosphotransferase